MTEIGAAAQVDPRLADAELRKAIADARKAAADARKAEIESLVPSVPSELSGGALTTPEEGSTVGAIAAYRAVDEIATRIAEDLKKRGASLVWIAQKGTLYRANLASIYVDSQFRSLECALNDVKLYLANLDEDQKRPVRFASEAASPHDRSPKSELSRSGLQVVDHEDSASAAPLVGAAALQLALSAVPAAFSLFRTSTTIRSSSMALNFDAAMSAVARELKVRDIRVAAEGVSFGLSDSIVSRMVNVEQMRDEISKHLLQVRSVKDSSESELAAGAERLTAYKAILEGVLKVTEAKDPSAMEKIFATLQKLAISNIETTAAEVAKLRSNRNIRAAIVEHIEQLISVADSLLVQLQSKDDGAVMLYLASLSEVLKEEQNAYMLVLEPAFFGRESVYEEKVGKDRGLHVGAAVISWFLLAPGGELVESKLEYGSAAATTQIGDAAVRWQSSKAAI